MSRFESFDAIDKHYNIRSLYESGRNRKDMNKDDKDRLKDVTIPNLKRSLNNKNLSNKRRRELYV